jgi:hypothetical protein
MAKINRSGSYGKGKHRKNAPSAVNYTARSGDADARSFDDFSKCGSFGGGDTDVLMGGQSAMSGHAKGPKNSGNES